MPVFHALTHDEIGHFKNSKFADNVETNITEQQLTFKPTYSTDRLMREVHAEARRTRPFII